MKIKKLYRPMAVALGLFLGRSAQADTIIDFDTISGQSNAAIPQSFGDFISASTDGITVSGFGTPNIGLTWAGTGGTTRWEFYNDSVWSAGQLNASTVGSFHQIAFTPNSPSVSAVVKSFSFHPYYDDSSERYTYSVSVLSDSTVVLGPITNTFLADSAKHVVSLNYTGAVNKVITVKLSRIASTSETDGGAGDIAVDDIVFAQLPETEIPTGPQVIAVTPVNGQLNVAPDLLYSATITNGTSALVSSSIQLRFNGALVTPTIASGDNVTNVTYQSASALLAPGSTNNYTLTYDDDSIPAKHFTNEVQYLVANYVDVKLPAPIVFEDFNSTTEGSLPAGWTATNLDTLRDPSSEPNINVTNLDSAAYTNWTVVDVSRFAGNFDMYSQLYNGVTQPPGEGDDYHRVLSVNPSNVVNGVFQRSLASGRIVFGDSGYRADALGQIVYLFSPDFNLTGKTNVYLSFRSLYEQNQDSIGAVEYSIDQGTNWLPIVYMLDGPDILTNLDGTVDALSTFTNVYAGGFEGVAQWNDPVNGIMGGYYGAFIGVASNEWSTLTPYISRRSDNNPVESKRVEIYRLPLADNQTTVRFRFAYAGTDGWYFGVDDFGLYSLPPLKINSISVSGSNVVLLWDGAAGTILQKTTSLSSPNWQDVAGTNGSSSLTEPATGSAFYRLVRAY